MRYRYGFNGKEKDDEISGNGNSYDYGFRIYNPRLGRFLSVDPLTSSYPWYAPYQFTGNKPIAAIDLDGLEEYVVTMRYNKKGQVAHIMIMSYKNAAGEAQDSKIHKNGKDVTNQKIMTIHLNEDGTERQPATYADAFTAEQEKAIKEGITSSTPIGPNKHNFSGLGYEGKAIFTSGTYDITKASFTYPVKFRGKVIKSGTRFTHANNFMYIGIAPFAQAGEITDDMKGYINKMTKVLNEADNISSINLSLTGVVGASVTGADEQEFSRQLNLVMDNIVKEFKKAGLSKDIKVNVTSVDYKKSNTGDAPGSGLKIDLK